MHAVTLMPGVNRTCTLGATPPLPSVRVDASLKVPVAVSARGAPAATVGPTGVTLTESSVGLTT